MDDDPMPPGGLPVVDPVWSAWSPWEVAERLGTLDVPWCVAAGWAIDLFAGPPYRRHDDLEVALPAGLFAAVRAQLPQLEFRPVGSGLAWPADDDEALAATHQTWGFDPDAGVYRVDVFREPSDLRAWVCRRDGGVRLPWSEAIHRTADGVPFLAPELALLFKAKATRPKDEHDLDRALPIMDGAARSRLSELLDRVHPGHPWRARVRSVTGGH